ncbi:MAG: class I tRNA ligase family protein, partial [Patescibacteria group bacterium]
GPFEDGGDFRDQGILGPHRFLDRVWKFGTSDKVNVTSDKGNTDSNLERILHRTIKKVTEDIEELHYNTAISALMMLMNELERQQTISHVTFSIFLKLLAPFAPHIADELYSQFGGKTSIHVSAWPKFDPKLVVEDIVELIVQVNGRLRGKISVSKNIQQSDAERLALEIPEVKKWIPTIPKKVIFVSGRMINFVV